MAIETLGLTLRTSDGLTLVGDLSRPEGTPRAGAVVCHPHPLYGGDRFNAVVEAVVRALAGIGVAALRFDFRGVNESEGQHGDGIGERLDVVAAIDQLATVVDGPLWLAGYSFGAATILGIDDRRCVGWLAVAPPLAMMGDTIAAATDPRPKHVVIAGRDQFSPPASARPIVDAWTNTKVTELPSADHFLGGHLADVARIAAEAFGS